MMQDSWQDHYQILSIIFLKEFIRLNVNTDTIKLAELNKSIATVFLNTQTLFNRTQIFMLRQKLSTKKKRFFNTYKFYNRDNNNLIYCCEKGLFILMNIWLTGKNAMKLHYLKKKIFIVT